MENENTHIFNVGDIVVGNDPSFYRITREGFIGVVLYSYGDAIKIIGINQELDRFTYGNRVFLVERDYFDNYTIDNQKVELGDLSQSIQDIVKYIVTDSRNRVANVNYDFVASNVYGEIDFNTFTTGTPVPGLEFSYTRTGASIGSMVVDEDEFTTADHELDCDDDISGDDLPYRDYGRKKILFAKNNFNTDIIQSKRAFGVELEAYAHSNNSIVDIAGDIDYTVGITGDGSLKEKGFELQFPLVNGNYAEELIKETTGILKRHESFVDATCGFHVHLQSKADEHTFVFIQRLMFVATIFDDVIMSFLPKSRRENRYCKPLSSYINLDRLLKAKTKIDLDRIWYKGYYDSSIKDEKTRKYSDTRYYGFNFHCYLSKYKHLEIRHHTGTINAEKILHWANLHTLILDAVRKSVKCCSDINNWSKKDMFLSLYDKKYETGNLDKATEVLFDFIGLSDSSRQHFLSRQVRFK